MTAGCRHWIGSDTAGRRCNAEVSLLGLCAKHYEVGKSRATKAIAAQAERSARAEAAWLARNAPRLAEMRASLDRAQKELERRTASPVDDRAAYGGKTHSAITRAQRQTLSDSNVARVVELQKIIERLTADVARIERGVSS